MIADMMSDEKLNQMVTDLFIRGRKRSVSTAFTTQSYFVVPKHVRLNSTHSFIKKLPKKREENKTRF